MRFAPLIALLAIVLLVAACKSAPPPTPPEPVFVPECYANSDCTGGPCIEASCNNGYCTQNVLLECCGNGQCEDLAGEERCSCPADCPSQGCEGNAQFTLPNGGYFYSEHFNQECIGKVCGIKYDPAKIDPNQEYHEIYVEGATFGVTIDYIQPFEINHGKLKIEFQLKDYGDCVIEPPFTIHEMRVMDGSVILGRTRNIRWEFEDVRDDIFSVEIPISYSMAVPEEVKMVTIEYDYEVQKKAMTLVCSPDGMTCNDQCTDTYLARTSSNLVLQNMISFIDPNYDRMKVDFSKDKD